MSSTKISKIQKIENGNQSVIIDLESILFIDFQEAKNDEGNDIAWISIHTHAGQDIDLYLSANPDITKEDFKKEYLNLYVKWKNFCENQQEAYVIHEY